MFPGPDSDHEVRLLVQPRTDQPTASQRVWARRCLGIAIACGGVAAGLGADKATGLLHTSSPTITSAPVARTVQPPRPLGANNSPKTLHSARSPPLSATVTSAAVAAERKEPFVASGPLLRLLALGSSALLVRAMARVLRSTKPTSGSLFVAMMAVSGDKDADTGLEAARARAGQYDPQPIRDALDAVIYGRAAVMFADAGSGGATEALGLLDRLRAAVHVVQLDTLPDGDAMRIELALRTGRADSPSIYIGATHIGDHSDLQRLHLAGQLTPMLAAAGALRRPDAEAPGTDATADEMIDALKGQIEAAQMAALKARIARNLGEAAGAEEGYGGAGPRTSPELGGSGGGGGYSRTRPGVGRPEPIYAASGPARRWHRLDAVATIREEEKNLLGAWTSESFYLAGSVGAFGTLLYFVSMGAP